MRTPLYFHTAGHSDDILRVIIIGRLSKSIDAGCDPQQAVSESHANVKCFLEGIHAGPINVTFVDTFGHGPSNAGVNAAEEVIKKHPHVVVLEDLSRISRNPNRLYRFLRDADEAGVRVISLGDGFDSAQIPSADSAP